MSSPPFAAAQPSAPRPQSRPAAGLWAARVAWAAIFALALGLLLRAAWIWYYNNSRPCDHPVNQQWIYCADFEAGLAQLGLTPTVYSAYTAALPLLAGLPFFGLSLLIRLRRSDRLMAVFFAAMLCGVGAAGKAYAPIVEWARTPGDVHDLSFYLIRLILFVAYGVGLGIVCAFPDGRFVPGWTRWLAAGWLALSAGNSFLPGSALDMWTWPAPLPHLAQVGVVLGVLFALLYRYRRVADAVQRQQLKWFAFGASLLIVSYLFDFGVWEIYPALTGQFLIQPGLPSVLWQLVQGTAWYAAQFFFALCVGFALFRYRLWDIDLIVNRALVYTGLTLGVLAVYVLCVGLLGALIRTSAAGVLSILATGLAAILVQPLRDRLQRGVNRLMYGERDDPVTVLGRLGQRLEAAVSPDALLASLAETVAQALKLPYVALELSLAGESPETVAFPPQAAAPRGLTALPLVYQGEAVGRLLAAPRAPGEAFSPLDRHLLENIARQAGLAVHAVGLTRELQRARQRSVAALEDERRRLRRDLHDGLGPALASQGLKLAAARQHLSGDPAAALALIEDVLAQNQATVADVRRLVYGLRPPALDERGLAEAIRDHLGPGSTDGLQVRVGDLPADFPPLPAAVEVAAYRIALEALTNIIRHARARTGAVRFGVAHQGSAAALQVEIEDDGAGLPTAPRAGVGLRSMRERAEELGGTLRVEPRPAGGTRVVALLPLASR
jgi:signal transduction histidine kinase